MSPEQRSQSGLSVRTLLIAGAASAVAAVVIPLVWRPGTVFAAAMTPIVVALVTELLRRPVETVGAVRVRRTARGTAVLEEPEEEEPFDPLAPPSAAELEDLPETRVSQRAVHRRRPLTARQWKLGLVTGLVAFAGAAGVVTASELLAGDAVSGGGARTTFFGGGSADRDDDAARREQQEPGPDEPRPGVSPEPTATPEPTETPEPTLTPEPTVTTEPPAAAPVPEEPTPAP